MGKSVALVTGAGGEMGHLLLPALQARGHEVVAVDLAALPPESASSCLETHQASVLDVEAIRALVSHHHPEIVFHLAAVLSTKAEREPDLAYDVNLAGTAALLRLCRDDARATGRSVRFLFPSSIAVYGLPDRAVKEAAGAVREEEWTNPSGLYGITKLQCEMLGTYWSRRASRDRVPGVDFRSLRFPGLISSETLPSGGTTDYAPEMLHAAAQGKPYVCFVRPDTRLPFMTMRDGVEAFVALSSTAGPEMESRVFNVRSFSASAEEIQDAVLMHYPDARISFEPVAARQAIVDSWPQDVDDARARREWGFCPRFGLAESLREDFVPALQRRYTVRAEP